MVLGCFEMFFICKNENFDFIEMVSLMVVSMHWVNLKCDQNVTILHTNKKKFESNERNCKFCNEKLTTVTSREPASYLKSLTFVYSYLLIFSLL